MSLLDFDLEEDPIWQSEAEAYGRRVLIYKSNGCDICAQEKKAIRIDTSDEEYLSLAICADCVKNFAELLCDPPAPSQPE